MKGKKDVEEWDCCGYRPIHWPFLYNTKRGQFIGLLWLQVFYIGEDLVAEGLRSLPARKSSKCSKSNLLVGDNVVVLERYVVLGS